MNKVEFNKLIDYGKKSTIQGEYKKVTSYDACRYFSKACKFSQKISHNC